MIQATQLKRGMCIKHDNDLYRVVEAQHKTPGNLRGLVQAKIKSLKTGAISDHRFRSVDMVERAILDVHSGHPWAQKFGRHVLLGEPGGSQYGAGIGKRPRSGLTQRDMLTPKIGKGSDQYLRSLLHAPCAALFTTSRRAIAVFFRLFFSHILTLLGLTIPARFLVMINMT